MMNTLSKSFQSMLAVATVNVICYVIPSDFLFQNVFSINKTSLLTILTSMFTHVNTEHLVYNMIALLGLSYPIFQQTTSRVWRSLGAALLVYFGAGLGSFVGLKLVSQVYEWQWNARVIEGQAAVACKHFICDAIGVNKWNKFLGNAYAHMLHGDERVSLWYFNWIPRVGASGAIYGILGARIYTALWSPCHHAPDTMFYASVAWMIAQDIKDAPALSLKGLSSHLIYSDNVDHVAHLCGLLTGFCAAHLLQCLPAHLPPPPTTTIRRPRWFMSFMGSNQRRGGRN